MKPLVITGCQRSGTAYVAVLVTACGHWCSHERFFNDIRQLGLNSTTCEASWAAAPFLSETDAHVIHQVRHPLDAIASYLHRNTFANKMRPSAQWTEQFIRLRRKGDTELTRAVRYWLQWNALVAEHADMQWRLEDLTPELVATTLTKFDRPTDVERVRQAMALIPSDVNASGRSTKLIWDQLPNVEKVKEAARQYGYEVP